jgi:general secretion pathway protein L
MALEAAAANSEQPRSIALYMTKVDAAIDVEAWQDELRTPLRIAGTWDWRSAPSDSGAAPLLQRNRWPGFRRSLAQLRPAAWIAAAALGLHAVALMTDWALLANEQRSLRQQMEARFRSAFPETVAVVDPALQMRRKLADARHAAGQPDSGDFLPMIEKAGAAMKELPPNSLRAASFESGRLTLELTADEGMVRRLVARLSQAGLSVDPAPAPAPGPNTTTLITLHAS